VTVDWKDEEAITELTKAILLIKFNVEHYDIPKNYLVPRIPQRLQYIDWIADLFREVEGYDGE
jgi:23S rRNA (adenine1618-N6)-methyltransferase